MLSAGWTTKLLNCDATVQIGKFNRPQCRIKLVLGVLQQPGPQFWGPQLVKVENFYVLCKGSAFGTTPGPALALMRPW